MTRKSKTERIGTFEVSFVWQDGVVIRPYWEVQYLGDGTQTIFDTKREALAWIKEWEKRGK